MIKAELAVFFSHTSQRLAPARAGTQVVRLGAQCTDPWTTGQSRGVDVPAVHLTTYVKSSTLSGRTVVRSYIQICSAWWVTTILYNYGVTQAPLWLSRYNHTVMSPTIIKSSLTVGRGLFRFCSNICRNEKVTRKFWAYRNVSLEFTILPLICIQLGVTWHLKVWKIILSEALSGNTT